MVRVLSIRHPTWESNCAIYYPFCAHMPEFQRLVENSGLSLSLFISWKPRILRSMQLCIISHSPSNSVDTYVQFNSHLGPRVFWWHLSFTLYCTSNSYGYLLSLQLQFSAQCGQVQLGEWGSCPNCPLMWPSCCLFSEPVSAELAPASPSCVCVCVCAGGCMCA